MANEYGFYAGSGVTTADNYLRLSSNTAQFNNIPISMYSGGTERMRINTSYGIDMYMPSVYDEVAAISWRSTLNTGTAGVRIHAHDESDATGLYLESIASGAASNKTGYINLTAYNNAQTLVSQITMLAPNVGNSYVRISANEVDLGVSTSIVRLIGTTISLTGNLGTAWAGLSFGSGWVNFGANYNPGQYKRVGDLVFLRGLVLRSSGTGITIATLPVGYRPTVGIVLVGVATSSGAGRIDIHGDGTIILVSGSPAWVQLDSIVFSII